MKWIDKHPNDVSWSLSFFCGILSGGISSLSRDLTFLWFVGSIGFITYTFFLHWFEMARLHVQWYHYILYVDVRPPCDAWLRAIYWMSIIPFTGYPSVHYEWQFLPLGCIVLKKCMQICFDAKNMKLTRKDRHNKSININRFFKLNVF